MNTFLKRTLSGAVYGGIVVSSISVHPAFFGIVFMVITALAVHEYHKLVGSSAKATAYASASAVLLFAAMYFYFAHDEWSKWLFFMYIVVLMLGMIHELFAQYSNPIHNWGHLCSSQLMIAFPFALMNGVLLHNKFLLLALFIMIWINDSGAYIIGSLMAKRPQGNHKMFPRVSPAKSWEGLIGGVVFSLIAGYVFYQVGWTDTLGLTAYPLLDSFLFAVVISVFGTLGDLMESLLKRTLGVKDSGKFMPGHGGVLDRFDSLLLATPVVYFLFVYLVTYVI